MTLKNCIRLWRKHRGMGQKELAARVTLTRQTISNIERGRRGFSSDTLERMAVALDCTPAQLLSVDPFGAERDVPTALCLRRRSEILERLALLIECYPQRVPLAVQVVARLADHNRSHQKSGR